MIESIYLSLLFLFPGTIILTLISTNFKFKYLLGPFTSFAYFNFLSILFFIFNLGAFKFWFYVFALLPIFLIFKVKNKNELFKNYLIMNIGFIVLNTLLNYFSLISLPGNTYHTFDELYKVFYLGTSNMDIGLIPLPMFTAGLFTNYDFDYSLINIFFIQFVFTALFSIFNYVKNKKELLICLIFLFSNLMIFEVFYELITYRSHSLSASALMILFVSFHRFKNSDPEMLILFFTIFILFNSRLENVLFGYLYIFIFKLLNPDKFESSKNLILFSSFLAGLYLVVTLRTLPEDDIRSNPLFILFFVILGLIFVYKSFFNDKFIFITSLLFVTIYSLIFYLNNKEIFRSVISVVYTKLLDPNSGFGLQFLVIICIFLYLSTEAETIPSSFINYFLFVLVLTVLIGILQTNIFVPDTTVDSLENKSIFNPLDLSIFRSLTQTLAVFWLFFTAAVLEKKDLSR